MFWETSHDDLNKKINRLESKVSSASTVFEFVKQIV